MRVTLLGTGSPGPNPDRAPSAALVEIGDETLLFDAGSGTMRQMFRAGTPIARVNPVFLTHHHFDHIGDLFDVIIMTALSGRTEPLRIFGPVGTEAIVSALIDHVYARDIRSRILDAAQQHRRGFASTIDAACIARIDCRDVTAGPVAATTRWSVRAGTVLHGAFPEDPTFDWCCLGYRIEADGRVVVISGDTVPCPGLVDLARDADLLVQCCHFPESAVADPAVGAMTEHTLPSAGQIGPLAAAAGVKHVVLTHLSMRIRGPGMLDALRADVARSYDGRITVGEDLAVFDV